MIILYNPVSNALRKPVLPMSLLALGALLEGHHEYCIIDGNLERDALAAIERAVRDHGARMLGVTVMPGPQLHEAVPLCRELKARHPDLTIVWGGYFPTQHYEACLKASYVDYVVRGHGEVVFKALIDALASGGDVAAIPGVAYRRMGSTPPPVVTAGVIPLQQSPVVSNPLAAIPRPDDLPDFPYQRVDVARYIRPTFMGQRTLPHHSSYGCPFFCNFCAVVNMVNGRWIAQSAERTAATTRYLANTFGVDAVEFYDNNFFVHEARTLEFSERIMDLKIGWWGEARIDTMLKYRDTTWQKMRESGLRMVFLGAESGSDATLQRMNKGGSASVAKTIEIAQKMRRYGIVPEMSFVLGNPPDPESDTEETIAFIRKIKQVNPETEVIMYLYTPVPLAGELYDQAKAEGFRFPETLEEWINPEWQEFSQRRSTTMPWLKDPLRQRIRDFERVLNAYYPTSTDIRLGGWRRLALRGVSAWRYHSRTYQFPLELRAMQKLITYQRPDTAGF
ncbi:MAG: B12-binding domain-containing radical SAM protein [Roseiflexaceae bacterium]|nr:B12-binding domain-containing radical SAM protein [Roseiflexaceae bacterium]